MAEGFSRVHLTGDEVLDLLDMDGDDGGMDEIFFPGSDDELGFLDEEFSSDNESSGEDSRYETRTITLHNIKST